jgi:energy-coupling factor transporter ATP-binding protein EcfA2
MSHPPLCIREVALAGFGPHREAKRFLFPEGPAVLLGPNESGKSALLQALAATLFGLPATNDPGGFTTAHFRSVPAVREFWGEVAWESHGRRYRLHRAFESHRVRWVEETERGPRAIFEGEHNPLAKSQARSAYPPLLREQFGLGSLDLFLEAFCLGQVSTQADDLSADLQHLLSGSRTGRTDDVLQRLFDEVKGRTLATGDLGLLKPGNERAVNQREPGRIERLEEELAHARTEMETGRAGLERVNALSNERETIAVDRKALAASLEQRRQRVATLKRWTALEEERRRHEEELLRARSQLRELDEVEAKRKAEETSGDAAHTALLGSPADLGTRLDALAAAEESLARRQREETEQETERSRLETEAKELQARLDGELALLRWMDDPVSLRRGLAEAIRIRDQRAGDMALVATRIAAIENRLASETAWPEDLDPVLLRARADAFLRDTRRLAAIAERQLEVAGPLEGRIFLDDERMEALRRKLGIEERLRVIRARSRDLEIQAARQAEAMARAEADTERTRASEARTLAEIAEARLQAELVDARARQTASRRSSLISPWLSLLGAVAVGAGLHFGLDLGWPVSLGAGAVLFALLQIVSLLLQRGREKKLPPVPNGSTVDARRAVVAASPPAVASKPEMPTAPRMPDPTAEAISLEILSLRTERESLEASLPRLREQLGPFAEVSAPEIGRLEERWALLATERERLVAESRSLLKALLGAGVGADTSADTSADTDAGADKGPGTNTGLGTAGTRADMVTGDGTAADAGTPAATGPDEEEWTTIPASRLPDDVRDLFRLPRAPEPGTCAELAAWLSTLDEGAWKRCRDEAAGRRDLVELLRQERGTLADQETEMRHDPNVEELQNELSPFTVDTPDEDLDRLARDRHRAETDLRDRAARASQIPTQVILHARCEEAEKAFANARAALHDAWPMGPQTPSTGLRDWAAQVRQDVAAAREAATRSRGRDDTTAGILRAAGAVDRAEIERREASASATLGAARLERERLEAEDPFLASSREIRDPLDRAMRLRQIHESEERALADETRMDELLHGRDVALATELDTRQSGIGPNLAQLELRIRDMEEELARLRFERDALVLAYGWVGEAAERFRGTYREDLELRVSAQFAALTGRAGRRVRIDDRFRLIPVEPDGSEFSPTQLSQGARDQLHLAIRLAVADLLSGSVPLPLFLDDPFVHFDRERLEHLRVALERLAGSRQWVLLTHRADFATWGALVQVVSVTSK